MLKDSIVDIKKKIDNLIINAFDTVYIRDGENCYVDVRLIEFDYSVNEEKDLFPIVTVIVWFCCPFVSEDGLTLSLRIDLTKSYEFNIGHLASAFERCEDD